MNGIQFAFIFSLLINVVACAFIASDDNVPFPAKATIVTLILVILYTLIHAWANGQLKFIVGAV